MVAASVGWGPTIIRTRSLWFAAMSSLTYIVTWTFFASAPGVAAPVAGGFTAILGDVGQLLVLLAASLCLLPNSLGMTSRHA